MDIDTCWKCHPDKRRMEVIEKLLVNHFTLEIIQLKCTYCGYLQFQEYIVYRKVWIGHDGHWSEWYPNLKYEDEQINNSNYFNSS